MESIRLECTRICEVLYWTPQLKLLCFQASLLRICLFHLFSHKLLTTTLRNGQTPLDCFTKWQMPVESIAWKLLLPRYILPKLFQFWLVDRKEVIGNIGQRKKKRRRNATVISQIVEMETSATASKETYKNYVRKKLGKSDLHVHSASPDISTVLPVTWTFAKLATVQYCEELLS